MSRHQPQLYRFKLVYPPHRTAAVEYPVTAYRIEAHACGIVRTTPLSSTEMSGVLIREAVIRYERGLCDCVLCGLSNPTVGSNLCDCQECRRLGP